MKKRVLIILSLLMTMLSLPCHQVNAEQVNVDLEVGYEDPTTNQGGPSRGPVLVPEVDIDDNTLTFSTPCYGFTLELLDENGDVAYSTIITSTTVVLPSTLSGTYKLCLVPTDSNIYFYGYVMF